MLEEIGTLTREFDPATGALNGGTVVERRLGDLRGCFADAAAYEAALAREDSLLYRVTAVEPADGPGDLHYGFGVLFPGKVGDEYFLTKGHLHAKREAAEVYVGLRGEGMMLLEDEETGASRLEPLGAGRIVYVPGHTAHRTMNTGDAPLTYIGVFPADAGHDYGAIAERNFRKVLVERNGKPILVDRHR
jgi:glucose-6-phosphate isomerase